MIDRGGCSQAKPYGPANAFRGAFALFRYFTLACALPCSSITPHKHSSLKRGGRMIKAGRVWVLVVQLGRRPTVTLSSDDIRGDPGRVTSFLSGPKSFFMRLGLSACLNRIIRCGTRVHSAMTFPKVTQDLLHFPHLSLEAS